jgi:hypothetical protein
LRRWRLMRASASQAANPANQIHAVFRIIGKLPREFAAVANRRGWMTLFYTTQ